MKIEMQFEGCTVSGTINGKPFTVSQDGIATSMDGPFDPDGQRFADILSSRILEFCDETLRAINIVVDETDGFDPFAHLPEAVADEVYECLN